MAEYRFDDIAINSTEKKKPVESDKEHYLGLEHLDSGTFKVSRFGSEVAPIGDKLIMKKGDVLFGKRRAYQKKVAIAPFDGIFSAHGMVLRPKEDVIDKNFFPLFIASDYFLDAAIKISVGSLSPTINWRDLKELKFNLPELDEQKKLAEVLWQIVDTMESYKKLLAKTDEMVKAKFNELFENNNSHSNRKSVKTVCELINGSAFKPNEWTISGLPIVRIQNLNDEKASYNFYDGEIDNKYLINNGQLLFAWSGTPGTSFGAFIWNKGKAILNQHIFKVLPKIEINIEYLKIAFDMQLNEIIKKAHGGVGLRHITKNELEKIELVIPSINEQNSFAAFVQKSEESKAAIQASLDSLSAVYKKIIAENLGGR